MKRWLDSKDAPTGAQLLRSLPQLDVSEERTAMLERQLLTRVHVGSGGWLRNQPPFRLAFALLAFGGIAAAGTIGIRSFAPSPAPPAVAPREPQTDTLGPQRRVNAPPATPEPRPEEPTQSAFAPQGLDPPTVRATAPVARDDHEHLVIEAVRALKREVDPERAAQLARRYLSKSPHGPLSREAREVIAQASRQQNASEHSESK
jgi:hypothetical protein